MTIKEPSGFSLATGLTKIKNLQFILAKWITKIDRWQLYNALAIEKRSARNTFGKKSEAKKKSR